MRRWRSIRRRPTSATTRRCSISLLTAESWSTWDRRGGRVRRFARKLDSFDVQPLAGTEGALHPFFSPDGRSVGFLTHDQVKAYSFTTGTTAKGGVGRVGRGGTVALNDRLFFPSDEGRRLFRVNARGGTPVIAADRRDGFRYGRVTPDGTAVRGSHRRGGTGAGFAQ